MISRRSRQGDEMPLPRRRRFDNTTATTASDSLFFEDGGYGDNSGRPTVPHCVACNQNFRSEDELDAHLSTFHGPKNPPRNESSISGLHNDNIRNASNDDDSEYDLPVPTNGVVTRARTLVPASELEPQNNPVQGILISGRVTDFDFFQIDMDDPPLQQRPSRSTPRTLTNESTLSRENDKRVALHSDDDESSGNSGQCADEVRYETDPTEQSTSNLKKMLIAPNPAHVLTSRPTVKSAREELEKQRQKHTEEASVAVAESNEGAVTRAMDRAEQQHTNNHHENEPRFSDKSFSETTKYTPHILDSNRLHRLPLVSDELVLSNATDETSVAGISTHSTNGSNENTRSVVVDNQNARDCEMTGRVANAAVDDWDSNFRGAEFLLRNGPAYISKCTVLEGKQLGLWAENQRIHLNYGKKQFCTTEKQRRTIDKLNAIGFLWQHPGTAVHLALPEISPLTEDSAQNKGMSMVSWDRAFDMVSEYVSRTGDRVVIADKFEGFDLRKWASEQRQLLRGVTKKGYGSESNTVKVAKLNSIGFVWTNRLNGCQHDFETWLQILRQWMEKEGNGWIARSLEVHGEKLGQWAAGQRRKRNGVVFCDPSRRSQLDKLTSFGFQWYFPAWTSVGWDEMVSKARRYIEQNKGNGSIPFDVDFEGIPLGKWADMIRRIYQGSNEALLVSPEARARVDHLDKIGFVWAHGHAPFGTADDAMHGKAEGSILDQALARNSHPLHTASVSQNAGMDGSISHDVSNNLEQLKHQNNSSGVTDSKYAGDKRESPGVMARKVDFPSTLAATGSTVETGNSQESHVPCNPRRVLVGNAKECGFGHGKHASEDDSEMIEEDSVIQDMMHFHHHKKEITYLEVIHQSFQWWVGKSVELVGSVEKDNSDPVSRSLIEKNFMAIGELEILHTEKEDYMNAIDHSISLAEEKEFMAALNQSIKCAEIQEEKALQNRAIRSPLQWCDPETLKENGKHVYDYSNWDAAASWDFPRTKRRRFDLPRFDERGFDKNSICEVSSGVFTIRRKICGMESITQEKFRSNVVVPFVEIYGEKIASKLTRLPEDATNCHVIIRGSPQALSAFQSSLERWEQRRLKMPTERSFSLARCDVFPKGAATSENVSKALPHSATSSYEHFHAKYRDVIFAEFKSAGIHFKTAISSMWKRHKQNLKLGDLCFESCPCVFSLPLLTSGVVLDFLADPKNTYSDILDKADGVPTGLSNHFAEQFLGLLAKTYPNESPVQILERLLTLWKVHKAQANFGLICAQGCECIQGWETVFNCGDPSARKRDTFRNKRQAEAAIMDDQAFCLSIPKKTNANAPYDSSMLEAFTPSRSVGTSRLESTNEATRNRLHRTQPGNRIPRKERSSNQGFRGVDELDRVNRATCPNTAGRVEYEVVFATDRPMGYYFVDVLVKDQYQKQQSDPLSERTRCQVASVCPGARDPRILPGTTVVRALIQGRLIEVSSFVDLKYAYERAKTNHMPLRLVLVNSHVISQQSPISALSHAKGFNEKWSADGDWRGRFRDGWAGGAKSVQKFHRPRIDAPRPENVETTLVEKPIHSHFVPMAASATSKLPIPPADETDEWKMIDLSCRPRAQTKQTKTILKTSCNDDGEKLPKKVCFSTPACREWRFEKSSPATEFLLHRNSPEHDVMNKHEKDPDAAALETLQGMLESQDLDRIVTFFNQEGTASYSEETFQKLRKCAPSNGDEKSFFIHNLLKLFISGSVIGKEARFYRRWTFLGLKVTRIDDMDFAQLPKEGQKLSLEVFLTKRERDRCCSQSILELPIAAMHGSYDFPINEAKPAAFNPVTTPERSFEFRVVLDGEILGTTNMSMAMAYPICVSDLAYTICASDEMARDPDGFERFSVPVVSNRDSALDKARIHFEVRLRRDGSSNAIEDKRNTWKEKLADTIEDLLKKGVNKNKVTSAFLSPDAVCAGGTSLLESAIYLESQATVEKLLRLGADPNRGIGLVERLRRQVVDDVRDELARKRLGRLNSIAALLEEAKSRSLQSVEVRPRDSSTRVRLPQLRSDWFDYDLPQSRRCRRFDSDGSCSFGARCHFIHVQPSWGAQFDDFFKLIPEDGTMLPISLNAYMDHRRLRDGRDSQGVYRWTACYKDVTSTGQGNHFRGQRVIYAESSGADRNEAGVCWYNSREDAEEALQRAITLSCWAEKNQVSPLPSTARDPHKSRPPPNLITKNYNSKKRKNRASHCTGAIRGAKRRMSSSGGPSHQTDPHGFLSDSPEQPQEEN